VAQRLDLERRTLAGDPVTLADDVRLTANNFSAGWSMTVPGLVAYRTGGGAARQLRWMDPSGTTLETVGDPDGSARNPRVSPDGRRVVVERTLQGNVDLWLLDGTRQSRLTFDQARDRVPVWSPDGARIVFRSTRTGVADLYQMRANGAGGEERFVAGDQLMTPTSWSPDGRFVLYMRTDSQANADLWVVPMVGDHTPAVFLKTPFRETWGAFSPDGRWVAYQSDASGRNEVYVRPFVPPTPEASADTPGAGGGQWQVSAAGGIMPAWRPDGKALHFLNPAGAMMAAPISVVGATLEPGAPVVLFPTRIVGGGVDAQAGRQYDVAPDGRFLINTDLPGDVAPITLIQHWTPEAKK
jgi:Tol biopolymer transport system component